MANVHRQELAQRRLLNVLRDHGIAVMRTLEQKISDGGPGNQRIDPHVLSTSRDELLKRGQMARLKHRNVSWYYLPEIDRQRRNNRFQEQEPIHTALSREDLSIRIGQALEIAVFRLLRTQSLHSFGNYPDLEQHADDELYRKAEPPTDANGREIPGDKKLDFLIAAGGESGLAGIEVKNVRVWIYPRNNDLRDLLLKCCHLDAVPILIARRIQYSTFTVFNPCGLIIHQTYNQRWPESEWELAQMAQARTLLGYHDIRLGNEPDLRLRRFVHENLPRILPERRRQFDKFKDLLWAYASGEMSYEEFAARVRRRKVGQPEDRDLSLDEELDDFGDDF